MLSSFSSISGTSEKAELPENRKTFVAQVGGSRINRNRKIRKKWYEAEDNSCNLCTRQLQCKQGWAALVTQGNYATVEVIDVDLRWEITKLCPEDTVNAVMLMHCFVQVVYMWKTWGKYCFISSLSLLIFCSIHALLLTCIMPQAYSHTNYHNHMYINH